MEETQELMEIDSDAEFTAVNKEPEVTQTEPYGLQNAAVDLIQSLADRGHGGFQRFQGLSGSGDVAFQQEENFLANGRMASNSLLQLRSAKKNSAPAPGNDWFSRRSGGGYHNDDDDDDEEDDPVGDKGPYHHPLNPSIKFSSIGGLEEQKNFLKMGVLYGIKHKERLTSWGVEPPKGVLLHGPPGTGKTMLVTAFANEMSAMVGKKVSLFVHKGAESLSMWFGGTEETLRRLFASAQRAKPSVIFFDEIDAICPRRTSRLDESSPAYSGIVTAILGMIDSVKRGEVFIIAATNLINSVDPAIIRPGRFDKCLLFPLPDNKARENIIQIYTETWAPAEKPADALLTEIIQKTLGFSGADLKVLTTSVAGFASARAFRAGKNVNPLVTRKDWLDGIAGIKPSAISVYGSALYNPEPTRILMNPLVDNSANCIAQKVSKLLDRAKFNVGLQSFIVVDSNIHDAGYHLNNVIQSVMNKISGPIYILDIATIWKKQEAGKGTVHRILCDINEEVKMSSSPNKPCILFIPKVDLLNQFLMAEAQIENTFVSILNNLKGSNHLIFGTWTGPFNTKESTELQHALSGSQTYHKLEQPSSEERLKFFQQLFPALVSEKGQREFLRSCAELTRGCKVEEMVVLFGRIRTVAASDGENKCKFSQGLHEILDNFETNRRN